MISVTTTLDMRNIPDIFALSWDWDELRLYASLPSFAAFAWQSCLDSSRITMVVHTELQDKPKRSPQRCVYVCVCVQQLCASHRHAIDFVRSRHFAEQMLTVVANI